MLNKIIIVCFIFVFLYCCSVSKINNNNVHKNFDTTKNSNINVLDSIAKNEFKFDKFAASFSAKMTINNEVTTFEGEFKIFNDSILQINIVKFAFPFMKILLTKDSVKILERLSQVCITTSYSYFDSYLKNTDFYIFNSLLTGKFLKIKNLSYFNEKRDTINNDYILTNSNYSDKILHKTRIDHEKYRINEFYIYDIQNDKSVIVNYQYSIKTFDIETIKLCFTNKGNEKVFSLKYYNLKKNDDFNINFIVPNSYKKLSIY